MNVRHLADRIADALGTEWVAEDGHRADSARIVRPDDQALFLTVPGYGKHSGRLVITGSLPTEWFEHRTGDRAPRITVDPPRAPGQIARDITRRLLPDYVEWLDAIRANKEAAERRQSIIDAVVDRLTATILTAASVGPRTGGEEVQIGTWGARISGDARVQEDEVVFDIRMGHDDALAFAEWIAHRQEEE